MRTTFSLASFGLLALLPADAIAQQRAERTSPDGRWEPRTHLFDRALTVTAAAQRAGIETGALAPTAGFLSTNDAPEGDMPRDVAFTTDGTAAVIVNRDTDTVTFFDVATRTITHTVGVGDYPLDVAVTSQHVVVPNVFGDSVSVIDVATHAVVATVPITGTQPYFVRVTSDGALAVVGVINDAVSSALSVIDLATFTEIRSIPTVSQGVFGFFFTPESGISGEITTQFALSPDDQTVVLPDRFNSRVALYDVGTGAETLLATPALPTSVDVSLDGQLAVIGHEGSTKMVSKIDLTVPAVTASFATANDLFDQVIRVTHDKSHALIAVLNALEFVNLTTGATVATINTGTVGDIELSFDGQYAFVSNFNARIIDVASRTLVKTIPFASCYDAAASPIALRAVALNNRFREDIHLYDISGAAGFLEGSALTGVAPEGDAPRTLALAPDGRHVLVAHNTSDNAAILDLATSTVEAYVPTGLRSLGVAISPDGTTGVVANAGNDTVSIVDMASQTTVATLSVGQSPAEVVIAPDSQTAYVTTVAGTDRVHFIDLAGAGSSVTGSLVTGQMGSIGYTYGVLSGMAISPDGSTLALCISFSDQLMIVDTASRTEIARLTVGDFPIRAAFSPDSSRIYVTNSFTDDLTVAQKSAGVWSVIGSVGAIEFPLQVTVSEDGAFSYVGSFDFSNPSIHVISNGSITRVATIPLTSQPRSHVLAGSDLFVTLTDGDLVRIHAAGASSSVVDSVPLAGSPSDLVYSAARNVAVCAEPGVLDGVDLVSFGVGEKYCTSTANSTGSPADLAASGSASVAAADLVLTASPVPNQNGIFFHGVNQAQLPFGNGFLCTTGGIARGAVTSGSANVATYAYDGSDAKHSLAPYVSTTRNFQYWFRDPMAGGALFNTSNAISIAIVP